LQVKTQKFNNFLLFSCIFEFCVLTFTFYIMREITLEELLEAGCHFGHQVNRRNPKADEYIYEARSGVHIIDLGKTREGLMKAAEFVKDLSARGGSMIVVGTKRQAQSIVEEDAKRAQEAGAKNLYYTTTRWIGGILTNFSEVCKNFKKLDEIDQILATQSSEYTKRERLLFDRERQKLLDLYRGVRDLKEIPDAVFVVDTHLEKTAVKEARKVGVTLLGISDTNADPDDVDYAIPANDDAVGSIKIITDYMIDAWVEGQKGKGEAESVKPFGSTQGKREAKKTEETNSESEEKKPSDEVKSQKSKVKSTSKEAKDISSEPK
jgi:small subunit ribosomal protein S2